MAEDDYFDLETEVNQRSEFVSYFFDRLDDVVWMLGKFCEHADWLMARECRISQLMAEVLIATTEVESILKYAEVFDQSMGEMLLLANSHELSQEYQYVMKQLQSILPRLLPYCSNELSDMGKLLMASEEENDTTKKLNRILLSKTQELERNFEQVLKLLSFHIDHAYRSFESLNDAQMKIIFDRQYSRYCNDNVKMLQEYADDIEDLRDAKKDLKKEGFSLPSLLNLFTRNTGKPHLLIREMRKACMYENHLIEIFAYKAKIEKLKEMKATHPESATEIGKMVVKSVVVNNFEAGSIDIKDYNSGADIKNVPLTKQQRIENLIRQEIEAAKAAEKGSKYILLPYKAAIEAGAISDTMNCSEFNSKYGCSVASPSFTEWIRGGRNKVIMYESTEIDPLIEQFSKILQS